MMLNLKEKAQKIMNITRRFDQVHESSPEELVGGIAGEAGNKNHSVSFEFINCSN
jgi:hypothetical protein